MADRETAEGAAAGGGAGAAAAAEGAGVGAGGDAAAASKERAEAARKAKEERRLAFQKKTDAKPKLTMHEAVAEEDTTPQGEKKDLSGPMREAYYPKLVEAAWDSWWEKQGLFAPDREAARAAGEGGRFVMVLPPPNVTGSLHLGHTLMTAVEDSLSRWRRMQGLPVEWLPGTDHAGIATQVVVEKRLQKDRGVTRHDLGRERFLEEVWAWKETYGNRICDQMRRLGVSVDWSRVEFTMSERLSKAVTEAFVRMFDKGLIYRDTRLVNWCCALNTAISDIEVEYTELEGRTLLAVPGHDPKRKYEFGVLVEFAYKIADEAGAPTDAELVVATTRLETMLGDTAVAIHSADARYTAFHGKRVVHPFRNCTIPVVCDDTLVDMAFGTGVVKVTPAHDANDFACGRRNGLEEISIFDDNGRINEVGGELFRGMMRYDARFHVERELEKRGLLRGKRDNKMVLGRCSRSNDVIEPRLKPQWWVDCREMGARAVRAVREGELQILPEFHKETWYRWLENIRDWCISRQLWWGHRIPAWFAVVRGQERAADTSRDHWIVARTEEEARATAAARFHVALEDITLEQDPDVLDTWFSSALFPFSTFGWPNEEDPDLKAFYPTTLLETGHDILFFWVARMVMMGQELTGKLPFKTVYLHAIVRDRYGRKMSKSLGNVIDPLEVIQGCSLDALQEKLTSSNLPQSEVAKAKAGQEKEFPEGIPECGADALRFGLLSYTLQGRDINLDVSRVVAYRHFCNKLWNATRFALQNFDASDAAAAAAASGAGGGGAAASGGGGSAAAGFVRPKFEMPRSFETMVAEIVEAKRAGRLAGRDRYILVRLNATIKEANEGLTAYNFGPVCQRLYTFWLDELCSMYLEVIKPVMRGEDTSSEVALTQKVLLLCLDCGLRLLHPMMPFVTEELWQRLPSRQSRWDERGSPQPVSIMIAPYPTAIDGLDDAEAEAGWAIADAVGVAIRALRMELSVKPRVETMLQARNDAGRAAFKLFASDIGTLCWASSIVELAEDAEVPAGCGSAVAGDVASAHLLLRGVIDVPAEITRLTNLKKGVLANLAKIEDKVGKPTYDKVPEDVKAKDTERISQLRAEIEGIDASIRRIELLRS